MMELETFFDNFDLMAEEPNGIQKLREMILQFSVRGKLVPQNPKDESASVLLDKIQAEKVQIVKKNIKSISVPSVQNQEKPFILPHGWVWLKIGHIFEFEYGKGLPKGAASNDGRIPVYGANGIKKYCREAYTEGPVIIVGRKGSAGAVNKVYQSCWPLDVTYFIHPSKFLNFEFVFHLLKSLHLENLAKGIKPGLNRNEVYNLTIGLPPTEEQTRIVAKVDELMALCDDLEVQKQKTHTTCIQLNDASIDKLLTASTPEKFNRHWKRIYDNFGLLYSKPDNVNMMRQAILQLAVQGKLVPQNPNDEPASVLIEKIRVKKERLVEESRINKPKSLKQVSSNEIPYQLPCGWEWTRIGNITLKIGSGSTPRGGKAVYRDKGIKFIRSQNVWNNGLRLDGVAHITPVIHEKMFGTTVQPKDLLLNITGASIGRSCIVPDNFDLGNVNQHVSIIRLVISRMRRYLHLWLISPYIQKTIMDVQVGISREGLSKGRIETLLAPLPPEDEQNRIVTKVDAIMALCDDLESILSQRQSDNCRLVEAAVADLLAA